jgi:DNA-binding response OmpR family regulator
MKKILIVEDDLDIQDIFRLVFENHGYEVECVDNGKAVFRPRNHWPDAIILDKQLPLMSGMDACARLKSGEQTRHIPVIMISATAGVQEAARLAGADDYLEKPFSMHMILKKIEDVLRRA